MAGTTTTRTAAKAGAKAERIRWADFPAAMPANLLIEHDPANRYRYMDNGAWRICTGRELAKMFGTSPGAGGATGAAAAAGAGKARGRATAGR